MDFNLQDIMNALADEGVREDVGKVLSDSGIDKDTLDAVGFDSLFAPENAQGLESIFGEALDIIGATGASDDPTGELVDSAVITVIQYVKNSCFADTLDRIIITRTEIPYAFEIYFVFGDKKVPLDAEKITPPEMKAELSSLIAKCAASPHDEEDTDDFFEDFAYALREYAWDELLKISDDFVITIE